MIRNLLVAAFLLAGSSAYASTDWNDAAGCGAPAPEIGAGIAGSIMAVAAVKYFRRKRNPAE